VLEDLARSRADLDAAWRPLAQRFAELVRATAGSDAAPAS
jgi:hypothetical protein